MHPKRRTPKDKPQQLSAFLPLGAALDELLKADPRTLDDRDPRRQRPDDLDCEYPDDKHLEAQPAEHSQAVRKAAFESHESPPSAQQHEPPPPTEVAPESKRAALAKEWPGKVDFREAEAAFFDTFGKHEQEIDLECGLEVARHGDQASAAVVADALVGKVAAWQKRRYGRLVLSDAFMLEKLERLAAWRISQHQARSKAQPPSERPQRPYNGQQSDRGRNTQTRRADGRAAQAHVLRAAGVSVKYIAHHLGCTIQSVYLWLKRIVDNWRIRAAERVLKSVSGTLPRAIAELLKTKTQTDRPALELFQARSPSESPQQGEFCTWFRNRWGNIVRIAAPLPSHIVKYQTDQASTHKAPA